MERSRRSRLLLAVSFLLLLPCAVSAAESGPSPAGNPLIASISFQVSSPYRISYEELTGLIPLRPGDRLTDEGVRASIRGLYEKSVFRQVSAYVRSREGEADLLFFLRPIPLVSEIEIRGAKRLTQARLIAATHLRRGSAVEGKDLRDAEAALRSFLAGKGFLKASVSVTSTCNVENGSGKVTVSIEEGPPAKVGEVLFPGARHVPPGRLMEIMGAKPGEPHDFRRWEEGLTRLRREYKKEGFLTVRLAESVSRCGRDPDRLCLRVDVEEGPWYELRWVGVRAFPSGKIAEASGLYGDEETSESALLHDLRERVLAFYRGRDYLEATVSVKVGEEVSGRVPITVSVDEGKPGYLAGIRFEGNHALSGDTLRRQMTSRPRGFFHWVTGSGTYREEEWNDDRNAIVGLYQKLGYARMKILGVDTKVAPDGGIVKTIRIEEGPRYLLRKIVFRGNDHILRPELLASIRNHEGGYVDYSGVERDQEVLAAHYRNAGYLDAQVESKVDFDTGKDSVALHFDIREGPKYRLGNIVVRGTLLTRAAVILRENPIPAGGAAGEKALLSFQQSVYATGLYKSVRFIRIRRPSEGILDLVVEVEEALFFDVEFGGGYGTDTGVRGFVGAKERNLDGLGRSLSGQVLLSQKEEKLLGDLREPYILGNRWKWEGQLTGSYQKAERRSFSLRKTGIVAGINRKLYERSSLSLQYELSRDDVFNVAPEAVLSPEDQGYATIGAVRALTVLDFRDDPFNPKRGTFLSGTAELATLPLGSEVDYYRFTGQGSIYFPVFRRNTFVVSARAGIIQPFGRSSEVPIQKRFFLGGRTTVRGFAEESLGPKAPDGTPIGGDVMVNFNTELRIPLLYGFIGAVFVDSGSVWFLRDPAYGFDMRESAGAGLRYITPVGPIGLDYGWKLNRRPGESPGEWHFTIGAVF